MLETAIFLAVGLYLGTGILLLLWFFPPCGPRTTRAKRSARSKVE